MSTTADITPELLQQLKEFRFNKDKHNRALVIKVDKASLSVTVDVALDPVDDNLSEISEALPETTPRFILVQYEYHSLDGRVAYPHVFISYSPPGVRTDIHMLYASVQQAVQRAAELGKAFELDDAEKLTSKWLVARLRETLTRA